MGCLVSIFTVRINSNLSSELYAAHQKGTYPNFWQSLTVTVYVLLSHDAKVNEPMWACQLCDVALVNKQTVVSPVEYADGKRPLRAYIAVCLHLLSAFPNIAHPYVYVGNMTSYAKIQTDRPNGACRQIGKNINLAWFLFLVLFF